jgi:hypothetical protein
MPERKGRKRRVVRERRRGSDGATATLDAPTSGPARTVAKARPVADNTAPLPSMTARATGLLIAVVTLGASFLMLYQTVTGDAGGIDGAARLIAGTFMIILAIVVGILSVAPAMVRDLFARRR